MFVFFFFFKQKTAYEMRISDWSSDVCSSDLKLTSNILAYGKVGSSYRAGGFNTRLSDPRAPSPVQVLFGNENSTSYEVGIKGSPIRRGYFAIAGYYTELEDLIAQVDDGCALTNPACPIAAVAYLTNAGVAKSWGI